MEGKLEIERSPNECFAFTVKKLGGNTAKLEDYVPVVCHLRDFGFLKHIEYEYDSHGKLHIHGIIMLRRGFYRKKLCVQGFHMKLELIYDEKGWEDYIIKHKYDTPSSCFKHLYLFSDDYLAKL